ncbi:conserved hypothetical protein [Ricinus communis]|uniref:Uncharacterized protein n=1 Tax=Ricinus communis TaxID=3988 RepID=B9SRG5_RICCO|nr:conserved hypothetical protein [Ricinus communis]
MRMLRLDEIHSSSKQKQQSHILKREELNPDFQLSSLPCLFCSNSFLGLPMQVVEEWSGG